MFQKMERGEYNFRHGLVMLPVRGSVGLGE
jgi:hypothetical protein